MNIEDAVVYGSLRRHLSAAAYVVISVLGGMAILFFAAAMCYEALQLIELII